MTHEQYLNVISSLCKAVEELITERNHYKEQYESVLKDQMRKEAILKFDLPIE